MNAEVLAKCKDGVRVLNVARGPLVVDEDLQAALDSGQGWRARRSTCSAPSRSPSTRCSTTTNVIVTPHLGASTAEATDRAGFQAAEQVVAALTGGVVTSAVNVPADLGRGPGGARAVSAAVPLAGRDRDRAGGRRGLVGRPHPDRLLRPARRP